MAGVLTLADFKTIADSIAKQAFDLNAAFTSAGFANNRTTILAEADLVVAAALGAFGVDPAQGLPALYATRKAALIANLGPLNTYLTTNDTRVSEYLNTLLSWGISPAYVMPPLYSGSSAPFNKLASYAATGATTGTFTDGAAIDITKYGKAWLRCKATSTIGGALVATIIGTKLDGTAQSQTATLTGLTNGQFANVGTLGTSAHNYKDVTNITITGGTNLDTFEVESRVERTIAL